MVFVFPGRSIGSRLSTQWIVVGAARPRTSRAQAWADGCRNRRPGGAPGRAGEARPGPSDASHGAPLGPLTASRSTKGPEAKAVGRADPVSCVAGAVGRGVGGVLRALRRVSPDITTRRGGRLNDKPPGGVLGGLRAVRGRYEIAGATGSGACESPSPSGSGAAGASGCLRTACLVAGSGYP